MNGFYDFYTIIYYTETLNNEIQVETFLLRCSQKFFEDSLLNYDLCIYLFIFYYYYLIPYWHFDLCYFFFFFFLTLQSNLTVPQ